MSRILQLEGKLIEFTRSPNTTRALLESILVSESIDHARGVLLAIEYCGNTI